MVALVLDKHVCPYHKTNEALRKTKVQIHGTTESNKLERTVFPTLPGELATEYKIRLMANRSGYSLL